MLITQRHYAHDQSIVTWLSGIGSVVGVSSTDLVLQNSDGTYTHILGSGISYDSFSQSWSGSFTMVARAVGATPDSPTMGVTTDILYSSAVTTSVLSVGLTRSFLWQLMKVPGNTNAGVGSWGNDTFAGSDRADSFDGGTGVDVVDYSFATLAVALDLSGGVLAAGAAAGDVLTAIEGVRGGALADTLRGNSGNNLLDGGAGNDLIYASTGLDTLAGGAGWDRLDMTGLAGDLTVSGNSVGSSQISGFESLVTGAGNDLIYGQPGDAEYLTNGGNDTVALSGTGQKAVQTGAGNDLVQVFGTSVLTLDLGADRDTLSFVLSTGAATQVTMTGIGSGTLSGVVNGTFAGVEVVQSGSMRLAYYGHDGRDEVQASISNDTLFGANGDDLLDAGNGNDLIYGDSDWGLQGGASAYGSDRVLAGGGDDTMHAGQGQDTYSGGSGTDVLSYRQLVDEYGNGVFSITLNADSTVTKAFTDYYGDTYTETDSILVSTGDDVEIIVGTIEGDTFNNAATGARVFEGGAGADLYNISAANGGDTVRGLGDGADVIRVAAGATATAQLAGAWTATAASYSNGSLSFDTMGFDLNLASLGGGAGVTIRNASTTDGATMTGTAWADRFESACAADVMQGGTGDDTYVVLGTAPFPLIFETTGGGTDLIITSMDGVHLGDPIENITLVGAAVTVRGNAYANRITGNDMANVIYGGGGADTMEGGKGSDTYYYTGSETLIEAPYVAPYYDIDLGWVIDRDRDRVISSVGFTLTDSGLEDLTLLAGARSGTGNLQGNAITGSGGANVLKGLGGNDTLAGAGGADVIWGGTGADRLRGDAGADTLRGEGGNDTLTGGDGNDWLTGGVGSNRLTGGGGADHFVFGAVAEKTVVTDFTDGIDTLAFAATTGLTVSYILKHAVQDGADVILTTPLAGMVITVQNTTIAALSGDILIL